MPKCHRPVKCRICRKARYYADDPRHVPEYTIDVRDGSRYIHYYYVHIPGMEGKAGVEWNRILGRFEEEV